ncbi:hypothetical protein [[Clostridium] aminophilum]|uniref:hypothetical protein n=1 Tax=[Clostridium] aminophilum TaxID=1526 RepID=UPI0033262C5C
MDNFVVLRRTQSEIDVFGGVVFIDIDGKNVGVLAKENLRFDLAPGKHSIKMYKSHTMGTFIGVAEAVIDIIEGESLFARYSAPLMLNQPGNIVIANYSSEQQLESVLNEVEASIYKDYTDQKMRIQRTKEESEKNSTNLFVWIFAMPAILGLLFWLIEMSIII